MAECRRKILLAGTSTNLLTGFNSVVQTNIAATAPTNIVTDTAVLPGKARFYRVGVEQ